MIRHYCDKCGKEIKHDADGKTIEITQFLNGRVVFRDLDFELCNECVEGLAEYLGTEVDWEKKDDKAI